MKKLLSLIFSTCIIALTFSTVFAQNDKYHNNQTTTITNQDNVEHTTTTGNVDNHETTIFNPVGNWDDSASDAKKKTVSDPWNPDGNGVITGTVTRSGGITMPSHHVPIAKPLCKPFVEGGLNSKAQLIEYLQGDYSGDYIGKVVYLSPQVYARMIGQAIIRGTADIRDLHDYIRLHDLCDVIANSPVRNIFWNAGQYAVYGIDRNLFTPTAIYRASRGTESVIDLNGDGSVCINMLCGNIMVRSGYYGPGPVNPPNGAYPEPTAIESQPVTTEAYYSYNDTTIRDFVIIALLALIIGLLIGYMLGRRNTTILNHLPAQPAPVAPQTPPSPNQPPRNVYHNATINNYYDGAPQLVNPPAPGKPLEKIKDIVSDMEKSEEDNDAAGKKS